MYSEEQIDKPTDEAHFWRMVVDNYDLARHVLEDYPVETKEEALEAGVRPAMLAVAYRRISSEYDQREHFYEMGRALLPIVKKLINQNTISAEFCQEWGKLMFCHGYIAGFVFDDSDDMANVRGAYESAATKTAATTLVKRWLAEVYALPQFSSMKRETADFEVAMFLAKLRSSITGTSQYPQGWFERILDGDGALRSSFTGKNFGRKQMASLRQVGARDLPPVPKFPR